MFRGTSFMAGSLLFAGAAFAATNVPVPTFTQIEAHSGARVTITHGAVQKVTVIKGDLNVSQIRVVDGGKLDINACPYTCPLFYKLEVEIITPSIQAIEAHGGGAVGVRGAFPKQAQISVSAHGGGAVDARAIPADHVTALAHGGGAVHVNALVSLTATAHGGGAISYSGTPQVTSSVHGGGAIAKD